MGELEEELTNTHHKTVPNSLRMQHKPLGIHQKNSQHLRRFGINQGHMRLLNHISIEILVQQFASSSPAGIVSLHQSDFVIVVKHTVEDLGWRSVGSDGMALGHEFIDDGWGADYEGFARSEVRGEEVVVDFGPLCESGLVRR